MFAQDVADQAVEGAGGVDHQALLAVEGDGACIFGDVLGQALELVVHGLAACDVGGQGLAVHVGHFGPAGKVLLLHVQGRQEGGAVGQLPQPQVAVFHHRHQGWGLLVGEEELPGQAGTAFAHVEVNRTAAAGKPGQLVGGALVVVEHDQLFCTAVNGRQHVGGQGEVEDVHRPPGHAGQVGQRRDLAVVQPEKLGLPAVVAPGRQCGGKAIGAAFAVEQHQRTGVSGVGSDVQAQGQQGTV